MRTSKRTMIALLLGTTLLVAPALAFDGAPVNQRDTAIPVLAGPPASVSKKQATSITPADTLQALEYAAEDGRSTATVAQWKLGQMYAAGNGVAHDDMRAFDYFSKIAKDHARDNPYQPQASIVANAFVALARYYLNGIPNSTVTPDPDRARDMLYYAATYFGSADAQYDLARFYLKMSNASQNELTYGTRWLGSAAQKGQHQAQALLGQMLFNGDRLPRQAARGLMWMALATDGSPEEPWIRDSYNQALARASENDRAMAAQMLEFYLQGRRN
jgi:TPR repeat protein